MEKPSQSGQNLPGQVSYWNSAGEVGYSEAMFASNRVGNRINQSIRALLLEASQAVGLKSDAKILELGCGDGELANDFLSRHFASIEAHDIAPAGIERANKLAKPNTKFFCSDITKTRFEPGQHWDAVFLIGIIHHVKSETPAIIERLSKVTNKIILLEPNGNNILRKFLETLPSYRAAGEDSFRLSEIREIFARNGLQEKFHKRFNVFPNFTPDSMYSVLSRIESVVENSKMLDFMCTAQIMAFEKRSNQ